ncbi:hypothetical protein ACFLQR_04045 [Verrucomicrobiota bacterium]
MIAIREKKRFLLGRVVITPPAEALLREAGKSHQEFLDRHAAGDWGDIPGDDWANNDDGIDSKGMLHSAYKVRGQDCIRIITESDRSATTILLPDDY